MLIVPFKANAACRHHIPKQRHRVTNWAEYDAALRQRGSLTVWFTEAAIAAWRAVPRTTPGGQPHYSALAILTALTLRAVFRLALRQTEGLIGSILRLLGLDLAVPDHTTADITTEGIAPSSGAASRPKLTPIARTGNASGIEARRPSGQSCGVHLMANETKRPLRSAAGRVGRVRRQAHPGCAARPAPTEHGQQHLDSEPVPAIRLEDFQARLIIELFPGQGVGDISADVIVANAPGVRITVGALPYLC